MIDDLYTDVLTIIPLQDTSDGQGGVTRDTRPGTTYQQVPGRIDDVRGASADRRVIAEQGTVATISHLASMPAVTYNADGTVAAKTVVPIEGRIRDQLNVEYLIVGTAKRGRTRFGTADHIEVPLSEVAGAQ